MRKHSAHIVPKKWDNVDENVLSVCEWICTEDALAAGGARIAGGTVIWKADMSVLATAILHRQSEQSEEAR